MIPLLLFAKEVFTVKHGSYNNNPVFGIKKEVLKKTLPKVFNNYRVKLKQGVWSEAWIALEQCKEDNSRINNDTRKGMYYPYARLMQLFDANFEYHDDKEFLTAAQVVALRQNISPNMIHRYDNDVMN